MAKTHQDFLEQANFVKSILESFDTIYRSKILKAIDIHTSIDYSDCVSASPAYVNVDAEGNIDGLDYTPAEYLSAVTFLLQLKNLMTNQAVTQGAYQVTVSAITDSE